VAGIIGVDPFTILNWETNATNPKFRFLPAIIRFLEYNPAPVTQEAPLHIRLKARRLELGLSLKRLANRLNLNESTIRKLEEGRAKKPAQETLKKIFGFLNPTN
jgi:DNA-binding XRE family transcriptional regulator